MMRALPFVHQPDRVARKSSDVSAVDWLYQTHVKTYSIFHVRCYGFPRGRKSLYNTVVYWIKQALVCLTTGNGGNAGRQTIYLTRLLGNIELKTCRGTGGQAAKNGVGGGGKVSHPLLHFENSFAHSQAVYRKFAVTHPLVNLL